jgi:two-component system, NtrC family, nitrogen regulation response regulator GlnG
MIDQTTLSHAGDSGGVDALAVPALTLLFHPVVARVGQRVRLVELAHGGEAALSRLTPAFGSADAPGPAEPIGDRFVSRSPVRLRRRGDSIELACSGASVRVDGQLVAARCQVPVARLAEGVVIELGKRVVVLLHELPPPRATRPTHGLIGHSPGLDEVRRAVERVADLDVPVLIRGESGTGKELVARALHEASARRDGPWVAVNMAAVPAQTAASLLFGHVRGAFTGAAADHRGYFQQAHGGTLFLDEIGDVPTDVQAMLLRVLEQHEVQPLGASRASRVDVRLIAATDADLDGGVERGAFRSALLHRLAGYQIPVPPLRARREDIGRLLVHFLREELAAVGEGGRLDAASAQPWLGAELAAVLARAPWRGNVRELRNVARQIVISSRGRDRAVIDDAVRHRYLDLAEAHPDGSVPPPAKHDAPSPEGIRAALERHGYRMAAAAAELGISRPRLYALAEGIRGVRTGRDLERVEIEASLAECGGDLDQVAASLRVSRRALALRMSELGVSRP